MFQFPIKSQFIGEISALDTAWLTFSFTFLCHLDEVQYIFPPNKISKMPGE